MKASVFVGTSVDGFIARPAGELDFLPPGGGEEHGYEAFMASVDTLVIGRKTYETVLAFKAWPYGDKPVVVLSGRPLAPAPAGARVERMSGEPAEIAARLEGRGLKHLYVDGGLTIQGFLRSGLIQSLVVTHVPVLIGEGVALFGRTDRDIHLEHIATRSYASGLVQSEYRVRIAGEAARERPSEPSVRPSPEAPRRAPERLETERLVLRRPRSEDAQAIFDRYASDAEATRWMSFPRHTTVAAAREFLASSESEWERSPGGPYLIESRADGRLLGGTGLRFETTWRAETGYILARDAWGKGYATEALRAVVAAAETAGVERLQALCHPNHPRSARVLEKCGFVREGLLRRHSVLPNLDAAVPQDMFSYARILESSGPGPAGPPRPRPEGSG
ncbi:MAG TPA: GNAT family N-acetyltransferase [Thermoanaerobaculia bacterium]|nr:GNAT family N-acetyltransferase [Thermoanaerobaculia bacterium]